MRLRFPNAVVRDAALDAWLNAQPGALGALARSWFAKMRACGRDMRELMHDGQATACVLDAPFAYVAVYKAHVNVGFFHGAALADPAGLLEGNGKFMRHVKVNANVDEAALTGLIESAYADVRHRLGGEVGRR